MKKSIYIFLSFLLFTTSYAKELVVQNVEKEQFLKDSLSLGVVDTLNNLLEEEESIFVAELVKLGVDVSSLRLSESNLEKIAQHNHFSAQIPLVETIYVVKINDLQIFVTVANFSQENYVMIKVEDTLALSFFNS